MRKVNLNDMTLGDLILYLETDAWFASADKLKGYIHVFVQDSEYHGIILEKLSPGDLLLRLHSAQQEYGGSLALSGSVSYGG